MEVANEIRGVAAVIFDMDGTLVDSEPIAARAVRTLLCELRIPQGELDDAQLHGLTWEHIAQRLIARYPALFGQPVARRLQALFHELVIEACPPLIPGAREAFVAASRAFPTAIATSSNRETVDHLLDRLALRSLCRATVCAEDCSRSKPDPQCFLIAAERLGSAPERCLVFEDSLAGLQGARAAGMHTVAIIRNKEDAALHAVRRIADVTTRDFTALGPGFFTAIGKEPAC